MKSSPVWTKPRVKALANLESAGAVEITDSIRATPAVLLTPRATVRFSSADLINSALAADGMGQVLFGSLLLCDLCDEMLFQVRDRKVPSPAGGAPALPQSFRSPIR